jgi:16S rRNA G527 N7-methylase RsmG
MPTPESVKRAEEILNKLETNDVANSRGFANWDFMTEQIALALDMAREEAVRELVEFVKNNWNEAPNEMLENLKHKAREMGVNVTDL